jgi:hypothetical protein
VCILTLNITLNIGVNMPKYHARYVRERYVKRDIRRDLYERLVSWCGERSINICLEKALAVLEANMASNKTHSTGTVLASNMAPNIGANIAPNTGAQSTTRGGAQSKVKAGEGKHVSGGHEWCRSKAKVRNLQSFIKWVDDSFGLIDWWEEDDRVCFETRKKPAKID